MTVNQLVQKYDQHGNVAMLIILHLTKYEQAELMMYLDEEPDFSLEKFESMMKEYLDGKPVQHVIGYEWFLGRKFNCGNGAFIPRYETEELVENTLYKIDEIFEDKKLTIADIGTGSGIISVSLDLETNSKTYATEISDEAATVAKLNSKELGADVEIIVGNMLDPLIGKGIKLDVLVSNPPYIKIEDYDSMEKRVTEHDPHVALFGKGENGLGFYEEILANSPKVLNDKFVMSFEYGWDQKEELEKLVLKYYPNNNYEFMKDINGKWRMLFIWS